MQRIYTSSLGFLIVLVGTIELRAQCDFQEDYSSNAGWTQIGVNVEISNGRLNYLNGAEDHTSQRRVHTPLGTTLDSNDCWVAELEFTPQQVGTKIGLPYTAHLILGLTAGTQEAFNDCPDLPCTGKPNGTQDGIMFNFTAFNPPDGDVFFTIHARNSGIEYRSQPSNYIVAPYLDTTYYLRGARISPTQVTLSVFWDASRTQHLSGSPFTLTIPSEITSLTTVQHGNIVRGEARRKLWGYLDNLCIDWSGAAIGNFLPTDTFFCAGSSVTLDIGQGATANYLWSTGSTDSIINISQAGTYWARIEDGCMQAYDTIVISEGFVSIELPNDTALCPGEQLTLNIGNGQFATYSWNNGSTDSVITVTQPGTYIGTVSDICTDSDTIVVDYFPPLQSQLSDTTICDGAPVVLSFQADDATYLWSTGETSASITVFEEGVYYVSVSNRCGTLVDSSRVTLEDCQECRVFLPNAFTPGNDNLNEYFAPVTNCGNIEYMLQVFDRWGKMVADLTHRDNGWDGTLNGTPLPTGIYSYRLEYIIPFRVPYQRDWINGYVMLLR
jgi:gliding motility-associated-like protein